MALAMTPFWQAFFLLLIWVPLVMLWMGALFDVFRRDDLGGGSKALWVFYFISRPSGATPEERAAMAQTGTATPPATAN